MKRRTWLVNEWWNLLSFLERTTFPYSICILQPHSSGLPTWCCCCCCCCQVTSVVSDSVWPHRWQPTRLPCPCDSPGKNTGVGCHFLLQCMKVKSESEVAQSCPTPSNSMDCSPPGSSVHGIFQAGALEWAALAFSIIISRSTYIAANGTISFFHWRYSFFLWLSNIPLYIGTPSLSIPLSMDI